MLPAAAALRRVRVVAHQGVRHVSENALRKRIQSTKNIQKITASMKMVSAAKMRGDQRRLDAGRNFGLSMSSVLKEQHRGEEEEEGEAEELAVKTTGPKKVLFVLVSSDRGLCGGVNTQVVRLLRSEVDKVQDAGDTFEIIVVGDKGRAQVLRRFPKQTRDCLDEAWKNPVNFTVASAMAEHVCAKDCDSVRVLFNQFKSVISFEPTVVEVPKFVSYRNLNPDTEAADDEPLDGMPHLATYDIEPEGKEGQLNLFEFTMASTLLGAFLENLASEQSARMTAMDNASKNAGDLIERLTLEYNRIRQTRITTELTEIISGAESLKKDD